MTVVPFVFTKSLNDAKLHEDVLDKHYSKWFIVTRADRSLQRNEVDRIFKDRKDGRIFLVEYKADSKAATSGNAFIETVSVDSSNALGWAYTSWAQLLVYYIPPLKEAIVVPMSEVKIRLPIWVQQYSTRPPVPNIGKNGTSYSTIGITPPLSELRSVATRIERIEA